MGKWNWKSLYSSSHRLLLSWHLKYFSMRDFMSYYLLGFLPVKCRHVSQNKVRVVVSSGRRNMSSCCRSRRRWPPAGTTACRWRRSSRGAVANWPRRWRWSNVPTRRSWEPNRLGSRFPWCLSRAAIRKPCWDWMYRIEITETRWFFYVFWFIFRCKHARTLTQIK